MEKKELVNTEPIERVLENIGVNSVFGEPTTENDTVVIPVAQVTFGFGYGGGYGESVVESDVVESDTEDADAENPVEGAGGGAGAGGKSSPRGFIRIKDGEVSFEPIEDQKIVPIAGIFMIVWSVFWVAATVRYIARQVAKTKQKRIKQG